MSQNEEAFWQAVEVGYGTPLAEPARRLLRCQPFVSKPYLGEWLAPSGALGKLPTESARQLVVQGATRLLRNLDEAGYAAPSAERAITPRTSSGKRDERWRLWADLRDRRAEILGLRHDEPPWTPVHVAFDRDRGAVVFSFDNRLSRPVVMGKVKRLWPQLIEWGWLRETRPPSERAMTLVRYVCLESRLGADWRERMEDWNSSRYVEEHPEWRYDTGSGLEKAFHRAERSLAGPQIEITAYDLKAGKVLTQKTARPLSVFYDPYSQEAARAISRMNTQASAALAGNAEAQREEIAAWQQTDPELAEALLASFQFDAETEELLTGDQAGDAAAGEEAYNRVYMQRGYWPAEELRKRLPQALHDPGTGVHSKRNDPQVQRQPTGEQARAFQGAVTDALLARGSNDRNDEPVSPAKVRCTRCSAWVPLADSVLGLCLDCARAVSGEREME